MAMPALEQNRSIAPNRSSVVLTRPSTSPSRVTSVATASPRISSATARAIAVEVGDDDRLRALSGKPAAQRTPDPVRAAGHDDDFVREFQLELCYLRLVTCYLR